MSRYDGELRFRTKMDDKGFNAGVAKLGSKIKGLTSSIATMAASAAAGFMFLATMAGLVVAAISKFVRGLVRGVNRVIRLGERTEALKNEFTELRASVRNAFLPLLEFVLPLLQRVAAWLTTIFNFIGMILGALTGQRTIMRATASAAEDAAGSTGQMAKNSQDAEKAAKGALASFDELNVLPMEEPSDESSGGSGVGGDSFELVPIDENILAFFDNLREKLAPLKEALSSLWDELTNLYNVISEALQPLWESMGLEADTLLEALVDLAVNGVEWLSTKIGELAAWIEENPEDFQKWVEALIVVGGLLIALFITPIIGGFLILALVIGLFALVLFGIVALVKWFIGVDWAGVWQSITDWAARALRSIGEFFSGLWESITDWAANTIRSIGQFFSELWTDITDWAARTIRSIIQIFTNIMSWIDRKVITPLGEWFSDTWDNIQTSFATAWTGILTFFKGIINKMIDFVNTLIRGIVSGLNAIIRGFNRINVTIPDWVPVVGGNSFGISLSTLSAPQIPRLASGAVIPPNSEFLAVLGDQRSGRNIETPEALMRQIVREELAGMTGGEEIKVTMPVYLDSEKIYEGQKTVQRRRGMNLISGGSIV